MTRRRRHLGRIIVWAVILSAGARLSGQDNGDLKRALEEVREQNRQLQSQLERQQRTIDALTRQFSKLQKTTQQQQSDYASLKASVEGEEAPKKQGASIGNVMISGEGGVGFFDGQRKTTFPNDELRVDEARLFVEAPLMEDIYFYSELDLRTREAVDDGTYLGEIYLDFENLSKFWNVDDLLSFRAGQIYTPFGEEYQERFAADNPLISHSLSDVWAVEGGAEVYGSWKKWAYALAVQSGDLDVLRDHTSDKTVAGRISFDPATHWHLSLSGQRTGDLSATADSLSGLWFGSGFFMPIGSTNTTKYDVKMGEGDARYTWKGGSAAAALGYAGYDDNDPAKHNHRDIYYYYLEGRQEIWRRLYGAARFSQIFAPGGYPVMGDSGEFGVAMDELWRLSLGLGWRANDHLTLKSEYTFEHGRRHDGTGRGSTDLFALEAVFKF